MSYSLELVDPVSKNSLILFAPHHMKGGTYPMCGEAYARLNITYNYSSFYYKLFPSRSPRTGETTYTSDPNGDISGLRYIYGLTGAESIPVLQDVISKLGDEANEDYWKATEGNAKRALLQLLALAQMRPDGVWQGD